MAVFGKGLHGANHVGQSHFFGVVHGATAEHREAVTGQVDHVDIRGALGDAFVQNLGAFVHQRVHAAFHDFLIADLARGDTQFGADLVYHLVHFRVVQGVAVARLVAVETGAGLLAVAAHLADAVGEDHLHHVRVFFVLALADGPADVATSQVRHAQRAHGKAELLDGLVDLLHAGAFFQHQQGFTLVLVDHAVADKAITHARHHGGFLDGFGQFHGSGQHVFGGFLTTHHFQQLHDVGRAEEVQADNVFRALGEAGDLVQVQGGGVGRQDRALFAYLVQLFEDRLFDAHFLEYGFDDQVHVAQVVISQGRIEQGHLGFGVVFAHAAFLDPTFVDLANGFHATVQAFLLHLNQGDRDASVQEVDADAGAHGAAADHANGLHIAGWSVRRYVGNLAGQPLGEECVAQGAGFRGLHQVYERLALDFHAFVEGHGDSRFHRFHTLQRGRVVLGHGTDGVLREHEEAFRVRVLGFQITHFFQWQVLADHLGGVGDGRVQQFAIDNLIEQSAALELLGGHYAA